MISKKLIKDAVTFLNNYLGCRNVICGYTYYGKDYIEINFAIWSVKQKLIDSNIASYHSYVFNEEDFNAFKKRVLDNFDKDLLIAKENTD